MSLTRVVAITGCDSGLGWAIAARSAREGLVTVAGMYHGTDSKAAQALEKLCAHPYPLDVTDSNSVARFKEYVMSLITDNPNYKLYAVVNNSGIMTIGDYEWQTPNMIENTINVNLLGAMRVVSAFLPDLRRSVNSASKPRIINVASHCGLHPLPAFGPYSASKAGLLAWTRALRMEHRSHGLTAVAFVPDFNLASLILHEEEALGVPFRHCLLLKWTGALRMKHRPHDLTAVALVPSGFVSSSNIMSNQVAYGNAMLDHLNDEQKSFYGPRIEALTKYLAATSKETSYDSLKDENIIETFVKALLDENPKELYKVESWRYMFYYNLLKLPLPEAVQHWLIKRFVNFPEGE